VNQSSNSPTLCTIKIKIESTLHRIESVSGSGISSGVTRSIINGHEPLKPDGGTGDCNANTSSVTDRGCEIGITVAP